MLVNELVRLDQVMLGCSPNVTPEIDLNEAINRVRRAWEQAAFSELPDHSVRRYFHHQLEGISKLSDTLFNDPKTDLVQLAQSKLLALIDHLFCYHLPEVNSAVNAPLAFHHRLSVELRDTRDVWLTKLVIVTFNPELKRCLEDWIKMTLTDYNGLRFSFRYLNYFKRLSAELFALDLMELDAEDHVVALLHRSNFNHLAFLNYRQQAIRHRAESLDHPSLRLCYLQHQKAEISGSAEITDGAYDLSWPSLKRMLTDWLQEQITLTEIARKKELETRPAVVADKQLIDFSVAHLACLIRLFLEENMLVAQNTKNVIQFFSAHFQTKKQATISAGSLSKEFYSIDQHTAARVRDMLQKMVHRINRNFFPAVAVISTAILAHSGTW